MNLKNLRILVITLLLASCTNKSIILSDISQTQANLVILILEQNDIKVDKSQLKNNNYIIEVDSQEEKNALQILKLNGFPRNNLSSLGEIFKKDGFMSSPLEEHGRYLYALNQELETMILQIDGVSQVKVNVNIPMPDENLWKSTQQKSSAAVLIKYRPGFNIDIYSNKIKQLVASTVPNLTPINVTLLTIAE
jgi:type III secretion protein J